jgi:uncharacterized damage-inducible protein DinB
MDARELLLSPTAYMPPPRVLSGLSAAQSGVRLSGASHSVVEIAAHMVYWQSWFLERCSGVARPMATSASLGWPAATADEWELWRERFLAGLERAVEIAAGESASVRRVDPPIEFPPLANYTIADAITHLAVHNAHHLGQIVTLRQILGAWPPPEGSWTW